MNLPVWMKDMQLTPTSHWMTNERGWCDFRSGYVAAPGKMEALVIPKL